ncbi:uncharacterized protein LOC130742613 isoform X2 [Lotus japonicus]|uniref:uncharacterized protein LOC130742613 isoform X2 n=1 Tax=Lotus japonicus TaxID=34305 RepID=UPI0025898A7A|nr:uncharacterized protein LOC130742613 isoform X2 [Lotus japonicus]
MRMLFTWRSEALVSLFLLLSLFTCNVSTTSTPLMSNPTQESDAIDICKTMFCGKGTCQASETELLGFTCDCDSGWKKIKVGVPPLEFELPPCLLPNCTLDMQCGNGSQLPSLQPPKDASNPCLLNFCGDGTCERIGSGFGFRCQCNEGSANILNDPRMTCLKKCALGAGCNGFDLGFHDPPPPPQQNTGPGSTGGSSGAMLNCSRGLQMLITIMILTIISHNWI